jgi:hypothetical protein
MSFGTPGRPIGCRYWLGCSKKTEDETRNYDLVAVKSSLVSDLARAVSLFHETSTILHGFVCMKWLPSCCPGRATSKPMQASLCNKLFCSTHHGSHSHSRPILVIQGPLLWSLTHCPGSQYLDSAGNSERLRINISQDQCWLMYVYRLDSLPPDVRAAQQHDIMSPQRPLNTPYQDNKPPPTGISKRTNHQP